MRAAAPFRYRFASLGDLNAFFALMLDNMLNLVILTGILVGAGFPAAFVYSHMIPGTALGVLVGDAVYSWMAVRLARRERRAEVTAMPLGLDTPSTIGIAVAVLVPVFRESGDAELTWHVGMAVMMIMGVVKLVFSFLGEAIRRLVPQAGLLGSLGGIGLALLAFLPLTKIFAMPLVGLVVLGLILATLVARVRLWGLPGAFVAVLVGTALYYVLGPLDLLGVPYAPPELSFALAAPVPGLGFIHGLGRVVRYLPLAIPFGLLTVVGGINVTESARVAGDRYRTRSVLLCEAFATLVAGLCGGVSQSTPYIGHPAYKAMGARAAYTLATGLFVGLGGCLGIVPFIVSALPEAAVTPILLFVGLEIIVQAFGGTERAHAPAVALSFLPSVAALVAIVLASLGIAAPEFLGDGAPRAAAAHGYTVILVLGNGFIITAMLWGAAAAHLIDRSFRAAALDLLACAVFSAFGLIHSSRVTGDLLLPWEASSRLSLLIAIGYAAAALLVFALSAAARSAAREGAAAG